MEHVVNKLGTLLECFGFGVLWVWSALGVECFGCGVLQVPSLQASAPGGIRSSSTLNVKPKAFSHTP